MGSTASVPPPETAALPASPARARIVIASGHAEPIAPKEVTISLAKPDAGIEPLERRALKAARSHWEVDGLVLPLAGIWQVRLGILVSDFETADLDGTITVKP
jgi:copper transport protein